MKRKLSIKKVIIGNMNKERPVLKIKSPVWRTKVGIYSFSHSKIIGRDSETKYWKITEFMN